MILTLNEKFEEYTPIEKIDNGTLLWREEYKAFAPTGETVRLIVFDWTKGPEGLADRINEEVRIYKILKAPTFHKFVNCDNQCRPVSWLAVTGCQRSMTLSEWVGRYGATDFATAMRIAADIASGLSDICKVTCGGGHYNICPDNIEIEYTGDEDTPEYKNVYINGLTFVNEPVEGNPPFYAKSLNVLYRAPETRFGKYNYLSDIYSLGVVMAYMVAGAYPWQVDGLTSIADIDAKRTVPFKVDGMPRRLYVTINRCIMRSVSSRFKTYQDIISLLNQHNIESGVVPPISSDKVKRQLEREDEKGRDTNHRYNNDNTYDHMEQEAPPQPKCNVEFSYIIGNGFSDVAGMEEVKKKFKRNFIDIVNNKEMAQEFDIMPPSLTLLAGPQGCGKTFLAKKLAEECSLCFSYISPAQLGNIYIHGSQHMIADLFKKAEEKAKAEGRGVLMMLDEFDAMAPTRTTDSNNGHNDEVNELLTQINDCSSRGIYIIAATNRPDIIDSAITRSGRMDDFIYIGLPDKQTRIEMFKLSLKKRPHEQDLDLNRLGDLTEGYTNSDIDAIIKEASRSAFDESISRGDGSLVKISQELIENTISTRRPSVSPDEIKEYEHMRDRFLRLDQKQRRRVGF